jgi:hypothetical protein
VETDNEYENEKRFGEITVEKTKLDCTGLYWTKLPCKMKDTKTRAHTYIPTIR